MGVDRNIIEKRVLQILNAAPQMADGSANYTNVSVGDDGRALQDVKDAVTQAGLRLLRTRCMAQGDAQRSELLVDVDVDDGQLLGDALPGYIGPPGHPMIQPFAGADFVAADMSKDILEIEAYRQNYLQLYSETNHDQADANGYPSPLAGFANFRDTRLFFTGFKCNVPLAIFTRADVDTKIRNEDEDTWVRLAVPLCKKKGDGGWLTAIFNQYGQEGERDLQMILEGAAVVPPLEDAEMKAESMKAA